LQQLGKNTPKKPIRVDFATKKIIRRIKAKHKEDIAKAVGISGKTKLHVLDATAGLGRDAFMLAALGCSVTMLENSPIIAALLEDGLVRAANNPNLRKIISRMQLIKINNIQYMQQLISSQKPDVVYLDPMFPRRKKSALVKKEMQILKELLSNAEPIDELQLLTTAIHCTKKLQDSNFLSHFSVPRRAGSHEWLPAKTRVVVKRPRLAKPLANQQPNFSIKGKTCRFDIY
jgi:16S rRNA (guanine1516-N2)-methyltransferase